MWSCRRACRRFCKGWGFIFGALLLLMATFMVSVESPRMLEDG